MEKILEEFNKANRILVTGHVNQDGDCVGAGLALTLGLNKLNNKVENLKWVSFSDNLQESYLMGRRNTKNQSYITENELKNKEWR